jgi:hypothetical protein
MGNGVNGCHPAYSVKDGAGTAPGGQPLERINATHVAGGQPAGLGTWAFPILADNDGLTGVWEIASLRMVLVDTLPPR